MRVLYVCTGNTSRSPFLEAITRTLALRTVPALGRRLLVSGAGIDARPGEPLDPAIAVVLAERGIEPPVGWAQPVTAQRCAEADLILTAEPHHRDELTGRFPEVAGRVFTLGEYAAQVHPAGAGPDTHIPDPYGLGLDVARRTADLMTDQVARILLSLLGQAQPPR